MTDTEVDVDRTVAEILVGRYDGHLVDLSEAIVGRTRDTNVRICWRMNLDGDTWDEDSVTAGELAFAEVMLSRQHRRPVSYLELNPRASIEHRTALLIAHLHKAMGMDVADAVKRAESITIPEQEKMFELYEVGDAPKDESASTSS